MLAVAMVVAMAVAATEAAAVVAAFSVNKLDVKYAREQANLSVLVRIYNLFFYPSFLIRSLNSFGEQLLYLLNNL